MFLLTISYVRNTQRCFDQNCLVVVGLFEVKFLVFKKKKTYEHTILNKHWWTELDVGLKWFIVYWNFSGANAPPRSSWDTKREVPLLFSPGGSNKDDEDDGPYN